MKNRTSRDTYVPTRRQLQLEECLYNMLLSEPYSAITVSDICRSVGLSRRTYYSYFANKEACLRSIVDRYTRRILFYTTQNPAKGSSILDVCITLMSSIKEHKRMLDILTQNHLVHILLEQCIQIAKTEDRSLLSGVYPAEAELDEDILACHLACQLTLALRWHKRGFDTSVEEMGEKYLKIARLSLSDLVNYNLTDPEKQKLF